jgi:hypothetical protein
MTQFYANFLYSFPKLFIINATGCLKIDAAHMEETDIREIVESSSHHVPFQMNVINGVTERSYCGCMYGDYCMLNCS